MFDVTFDGEAINIGDTSRDGSNAWFINRYAELVEAGCDGYTVTKDRECWAWTIKKPTTGHQRRQ